MTHIAGVDILGEIGCLLSHRRVCEIIQQEQIPVSLVLEDDVLLSDDFGGVVRSLVSSRIRWDIIRFVGNEKIRQRGFRRIVPLEGDYWLVRLPTIPGGSYAYLITLDAAKTIWRQTSRAWLPIDALLGSAWFTGVEVFSVDPPPALHDFTQPSGIGDGRFSKKNELVGLQRAFFPVFRFLFKLVEGIGKRFYYWSSWFRDRRSSMLGQHLRI